MTTYVFTDHISAYATLNAAIDDSVTTIVLTAGTGANLPSPTGGDVAPVRIDNEGITYTTRTTDTLTGVTRGAFAGPAAAHSAGRQVKNVIPADLLNSISGGGGGGTVTSVALTVPAELSVSGSPITGAGTLAVSKAVQNANKVYAGPTTGADAQPAFRVLVAADVPTHASTHNSGGGDALAADAAAGTPSLRSLSTTSTTAAAGNDSRFPTSGEKAALAGTSGTPGSGNKYVTDGDSRNSDSRTPTSHGASDHSGDVLPDASDQTLGAGTLSIAEQAAPSNPASGTRKLYVDSTSHKLSVRTSAGTTVSLEEAGGGGASFDDSEGDPARVTAAAGADGTSSNAARRDHAHQDGAGLTVSGNSSTDYTFTTTVTDVSGATCTVTRAGIWQVAVNIGGTVVGSGDANVTLRASLQKNGTAYAEPIAAGPAGTIFTIGDSRPLSLANGDVLKIRASKDSGSGTSKIFGTRCEILATWLRPSS